MESKTIKNHKKFYQMKGEIKNYLPPIKFACHVTSFEH